MLGALADDATAQAAEPPLISVMVPTCNRPAFVKLTLRQIERRTWSNLEVLVVDDSPSGTADEAELRAAFPRLGVRVVPRSRTAPNGTTSWASPPTLGCAASSSGR